MCNTIYGQLKDFSSNIWKLFHSLGDKVFKNLVNVIKRLSGKGDLFFSFSTRRDV